ncbi:MAG: polysaccharide biosynthesis protein [Gammaproteobacteria bacterium]
MIAAAWELAWFARYNYALPDRELLWTNLQVLPLVVAVQGAVAWYFGLYRGVWRFASVPDLWNIVRAAALGTIAVLIALFLATRLQGIPRSMLALFPLFLVFLLGTPRLVYRVWKDHSLNLRQLAAGTRVLIVGAGRAGEGLARQMLRGGEYTPVGFIDDKKRLHDSNIHGLPVLGAVPDLARVAGRVQANLVVIAIPSATGAQMQRIVEACMKSGVPYRTLPASVMDRGGTAFLSQLREVSLEDLLGRARVDLDWRRISEGLAGRTILVTGGGGSIGSELCRQIARVGPGRLIVLDRSEHNLFTIDAELQRSHPQVPLVSRLGDVCDQRAMQVLFETCRPEIVFHAAAYKHVPLLQDQAREAVRNNVLGTRVVAEAARAADCRQFVLISTDKAVNPSSVMGMCKRVAEMLCESMNGSGQTRFVTVRFGNVLGSAGSVVPIFREQLAAGGPLTVTHPDVVRYFMTIPEACQLITQAAVMGQGGEIYVLDMGEPVRIAYLAEQMIRLSGREPGRDIKIEYIGLRPGEKLFEDLFHAEEQALPTEHAKIRLCRHRAIDREAFRRQMDGLLAACHAMDEAQIQGQLRGIVPEYHATVTDAGDLRVVPIRSRTAS